MALQLTRTTRGTRSNFFPFHSLPSLFPSHFYFSILPPCFVHLKFTDNLETLEWIFSLLFLSVFSIIRDFKYRLSRKEYDRFCRIFFSLVFPFSLFLFIFTASKSRCPVYPERSKLNIVFIYLITSVENEFAHNFGFLVSARVLIINFHINDQKNGRV